MGRIKKVYVTPKVILFKEDIDLDRCILYLRQGEEIIVNVSIVELKDRYRVIAFISGFVMAFNGKRKKLEENIYSFKIK